MHLCSDKVTKTCLSMVGLGRMPYLTTNRTSLTLVRDPIFTSSVDVSRHT